MDTLKPGKKTMLLWLFSFCFMQMGNSQTCSRAVYDNWLNEQCGNYAYNGDFSLPVAGGPINEDIPDPGGGGNISQSCMWTKVGKQEGHIGNFHHGTTDLFLPNNPAFTNNTPIHLGVPANSMGVMNDHTTGSSNQTGYMGLYTYYMGNNYHEYVINKYSFHLTAGVTYTFSFWASLAPWSSYATHIDAWVGREVDMPTMPGGNFSGHIVYPVVPAATTKRVNGSILSNIGSWNQITFTFTPGITDEYFLVLGNFFDNALTAHPASPGGNLGPYAAAKIPGSYYYIDDIKVSGKGPEFCCVADYEYIDNNSDNNTPNTDIYYSSFPTPTPGSLGATFPWGSTIYVNGKLHINQSINLFFVTIDFSPGSVLIVDPGVTVNIKYSYLKGCPRMWEGIRCTSPTSSINIENSTISDAIYAVACQGGVPLSMKNNVLLNNLNGVGLSFFSGSWPFTFIGNEIKCTSTLLPPLNTSYSNYGIFVSNVGTLGLNFAGTQNKFIDLQTSVSLTNVNANVSNLFINNTGVNPSPFTMGIYSHSSPGNLKWVNISNYNGTNTIKNVYNGIHFFGNFYCLVEKCNLENIKNVGISFAKNAWFNLYPTEQIKCNDNYIHNARIGITLNEIYDTRVKVNNNTLLNDNYIPNSFGINFINTFQNAKKCDQNGYLNKQYIQDNLIQRFQVGVNTEQCNCLNVVDNDVDMLNTFGYFTQFHGIWSKACTNGSIGTNDITGGSLNPSACIGMRLQNHNVEKVYCNNISTCDYSIWMEGASSYYTRMEKNVISNYRHGFYFTGNLFLENQLNNSGTTTPQIHLNEWTGKQTNGWSALEFTTAPSLNMTPTKFYFLTTDPNPDSDINNIQMVNLHPTLVPITHSHFPSACPEEFDVSSVNGVLRDTSNLHWDSTSVYGLQTQWLTDRGMMLTTQVYAEDIDFDNLPVPVQQHLDRINNHTSVPATLLVDKFVGENDFANATAANDAIDKKCEMGSLYQRFNEIALPFVENYRMLDTVILDSTDMEQILEIAGMCLYQYGQVVSSARSFAKNFINEELTFSNPCETEEAGESKSKEAGNVTQHVDFSIYPVPARDYLVINTGIETEMNYSIYDAQGKIRLTGKFSNTATIQVEGIAPGYYFIHLYNAAYDYREKFSIAR